MSQETNLTEAFQQELSLFSDLLIKLQELFANAHEALEANDRTSMFKLFHEMKSFNNKVK